LDCEGASGDDEPRLFNAEEVIGRLDDEREQRIQDFDLNRKSASEFEYRIFMISSCSKR
jgi:hypothetical protein